MIEPEAKKVEILSFPPNFKKVLKILRQEISFVETSHQRKGIATYLLHFGLDFDKLKVVFSQALGFQKFRFTAGGIPRNPSRGNFFCQPNPTYKERLQRRGSD